MKTTVKQHTREPRKTEAQWKMQATLEEERKQGFRRRPDNQNDPFDEFDMLSIGNVVPAIREIN